MNCRLQSSRPCNHCMRSFISWQSRKSRTTLSTVRSEKRKKNCWLPNGRLKRFWISTGRKSRKRERERGKEELPLKQKATVCTPQKGADRGCFFAFRFRCFQPWANFYSTVLWETIENRVAIIGRWCSKGIGDASPTSKFAKIAPKGKSRKWVNLYRFTLLANLWDYEFSIENRVHLNFAMLQPYHRCMDELSILHWENHHAEHLRYVGLIPSLIQDQNQFYKQIHQPDTHFVS